MERKYYDLIISLIKKHKKYSGLEAILEDIANDVYEHSKVVLESVNSEDVIIAYLNKIISTSIVTVPKKMNFNIRVRHRDVSAILPQTPPVSDVVSDELYCSNAEPSIEKQEEVLEEVPDVTTSIIVEEEDNSLLKIEETSVENEIFDVAKTIAAAEEELSVSDEVVESTIQIPQNLQEDEPSQIEESFKSNTSNVDMSLVDKMINGVPAESEFNEDLSQDLSQDDEDLLAVYDSPEEFLPEDKLEIKDNNISEFEVSEEDNIDILSGEQEVDEKSDLGIEEDSLDYSMEFKNVEATDFPDIQDNSTRLSQTDSSELNIEIDDEPVSIEDLSQDGDDILSEVLPDEFYVEDETLQTDDVLEKDDFSVPTYKCFEFVPDKSKLATDIDDIKSTIIALDKKYPDRHLLTICELKYGQKMSIAQIASELNIEKGIVTDVLNQVIVAIKD